MKNLIPSEQQLAILSAQSSSRSNLFVQARAGTGKTATLEMSVNALPSYERIATLCCAFNKRIAVELEKRFAAEASPPICKTLNALGLGLLSRSIGRGRPEVDERKTYKIMKSLFESMDEDDWELISALVSKAKNDGRLPNPDGEFYLLGEVESYRESAPNIAPHHLDAANQVLVESIRLWEAERLIDFDDMLWLPLILGLRLPQYANIYVDEAQDLNPAQLALIATASGSRYIFFGDPAQAIYGFRGAINGACDRIIQEFSCTILPLTTTYRCARAIVREAQHYVPDIRAHQDAAPGLVTNVPQQPIPPLFSPVGTQFVLCRYNAPLIKLGLELLRTGVRFSFRNSRFESAFRGYLRKCRGNNKAMPVEEILAKSEALVASDPKFADYHDALLALAPEGSDLISSLKRVLNASAHDPNAPLLSTIHSAKGLEADQVIWLDDAKRTAAMKVSAEDRQQEDNLRYVCITRAKQHLLHVS